MAISPTSTQLHNTTGFWTTHEVKLPNTRNVAPLNPECPSPLSTPNTEISSSGGYLLHPDAEAEWLKLGFLELPDFGFNL